MCDSADIDPSEWTLSGLHRNVLQEAALTSVSSHLQVSVLADTSYNSLSVDEVAAQHAQADCVVILLAASAA